MCNSFCQTYPCGFYSCLYWPRQIKLSTCFWILLLASLIYLHFFTTIHHESSHAFWPYYTITCMQKHSYSTLSTITKKKEKNYFLQPKVKSSQTFTFFPSLFIYFSNGIKLFFCDNNYLVKLVVEAALNRET